MTILFCFPPRVERPNDLGRSLRPGIYGVLLFLIREGECSSFVLRQDQTDSNLITAKVADRIEIFRLVNNVLGSLLKRPNHLGVDLLNILI